MPRSTIADTAASLLAKHRALAPRELGRLMREQGVTRAKDPARAVSQALDVDRRFRRLADGRWAVPGQLLHGATLTHQFTSEEATTEMLAVTPDLAPLVALAPDRLLHPDGRPFTFVWERDALDAIGADTDIALEGPPGWLADCSAGQLVHGRVTGGVLSVGGGPEPRPETRLTARRIVEAARARLLEQEAWDILDLPPFVTLEALVLELLADDPGLLEHPLPPLSEAFVATGLEVHRGFVGMPGTDWADVDDFMSFDEADIDDLDALIDADDDLSIDDLDREIDAFDLAPAEADGVRLLLAAYGLARRLGGIDSREDDAGLARILGIPGIARVLAVKAWTDPEFEPFVAALAAAATGRDAAGARFVLGACAEARDDVGTAERLYRSALDADPDHFLALVEVARYETDRGDYTEALGHLRAARVPADDTERAWLQALARPSVPKVGRNDPCPCGSGRKYKACHLDGPGEIGSVDAGKALLHKLDAWLSQPNMQAIGGDLLADVRAGAPAGEDAAPIDPMLEDIVLFDRGGLRQFLDVRGGLLPETERALGRTWLLSRRSLFEVQAVKAGTGLTLRDLRSDDGNIDIADRSMSRQVEPLDLLLLRLLPDGLGGVVALDGVFVPRPQRRYVLDMLDSGDGLDLLRWIAEPAPLPRLANTEGEPLQLITVVYRVRDPAATSAALEKKLESRGDGRFDEMVVRHGQEWVRGSITLDGDRATIDANSGKRAARLERTLLRAAPGARLIRREERGIEEAFEEERANGPALEPIDVTAHPELAQAMEAFIRSAEVNWVDERIPALGGLTPREALADPAARPELDALLDDMAWRQDQAGGAVLMDPSRIRALLGIPDRKQRSPGRPSN